jgi:hypothetical protein
MLAYYIHKSHLQVLGMAWCGMQDAGAVAFGAMFKTNQVCV